MADAPSAQMALDALVSTSTASGEIRRLEVE